VEGEEIIAFIKKYLGSIYAVELLLLVMRDPERCWTTHDLIRELRSSGTAVAEALGRLVNAGLISEKADGCYAFAPVSAKHAQIAAEIEKLYLASPTSVIKAIVAIARTGLAPRSG
jgi:hypothetical protein